MKIETRLAPPNSLVLIMDQSVGEVPESMNGALVAATPTCVSVGTLSEHDGETSITISDEKPGCGLGLSVVFDGDLSTPAGNLAVCTVDDVAVVSTTVSSSKTRVQIWGNDNSEPNHIYVFILLNST